jgi:hypothetical protein
MSAKMGDRPREQRDRRTENESIDSKMMKSPAHAQPDGAARVPLVRPGGFRTVTRRGALNCERSVSGV